MIDRFHRIRSLRVAATASAAALALALAALAVFGRDGGVRGIEAASVPQAVYAQFSDEADTVFVAPLDDPASGRQLTAIGHARGWGIIGVVSPDGRWLAYTVLTAGARLPQTEARAHILSLIDGKDRVVAEGVDLQVRPVWSKASDRVAFMRGEAPEGGSGSFTALVARPGGGASEAGTVDRALAAYPVGFAGDGDALYVAIVDPTGTRLEALSGGARNAVTPLSDGLARDFALSPDGRKLAYTDVAPSAGAAFRVRVADLVAGLGASAAAPGTPVAAPGDFTLGPAWTPQGDLTFGVARAGSAALRVEGAGPSLSSSAARPVSGASADGFDVPLAWSPDGAGLAARAVTGSLGDVRGLRLTLIGGDGGRRPFGNADTKFLGWVPAGVGR